MWETGKERYVEHYPTLDELWAEVFKTPNEWRNRFAAVPFEERGGTWQTRYYQHNAIENRNAKQSDKADGRGNAERKAAEPKGQDSTRESQRDIEKNQEGRPHRAEDD